MDLITPAISLISAIIGAIIGGWMSQIASSEATEKAHRNNLKLQEKNRKADAYSKVIEALHNAKITANKLLQVEIGECQMSAENIKYLKSHEESAYGEIWKAMDVDSFLLSNEALVRLRQYEINMNNAWQETKIEGDWAKYYQTIQNAAEKCLKDIREIAKKDLMA